IKAKNDTVLDFDKNHLKNGDFEYGTHGNFVADEWVKSNNVFSKNHLEYDGVNKVQKINTLYGDQAICQPFVSASGDKIYYEVDIKAKVNDGDINLWIGLGNDPNGNFTTDVKLTELGLNRGVYTSIRTDMGYLGLFASGGIHSNAIVKSVYIINLTTRFGKGNEPTIEEIEEYGMHSIVTTTTIYNKIKEIEKKSVDLEIMEDFMYENLPTLAPNPPRLNWEIIRTTNERPRWLSDDGEVLWGDSGGTILLQSVDEWASTMQVGSAFAQNIQGVRELSTGELLVSTTWNEGTGMKGKLYKSVGYDRGNPTETVFTEVLELISPKAHIINHWGFSVYENIVLVSEYGLWDEEGAKYVYLSTDYGDTFEPIFNLLTQEIEGRPEIKPNAHVHSVAYDPYFNRIWVCVGDRPNTAVYYSDDMGETWVYVKGSSEVQFTGIIALPDCVVFGSDDSLYTGLFIYRRKHKSEMPTIKAFYLLDTPTTITHVFQTPFRKGWNPKTPVYFVGNKATTTTNKPVVIGFVDKIRAYLLWESNFSDNRDMWLVLGETAQGNLISYSRNPNEILKVQAPKWIYYIEERDEHLNSEMPHIIVDED
ncbi:MAG: hypothetical protein GX369_08195, partial [Euryarchaeota archaeon]|nr:hypothetical protein [Euryarchaeota archaeon]